MKNLRIAVACIGMPITIILFIAANCIIPINIFLALIVIPFYLLKGLVTWNPQWDEIKESFVMMFIAVLCAIQLWTNYVKNNEIEIDF